MANKNLFKRKSSAPPANAVNEAGGVAYKLAPKAALAQLACTATFNDGFYKDGAAQLQELVALANSDEVAPEFVAKAALYARQGGKMKDAPAALAAVLSLRDMKLLDKAFDRVIDSARMLRTFVQIVRSGLCGRKSLGSGPRRLIRRWLANRTDDAIFRASVGNDPSLGDVIALAHPKPATVERAALFGYLMGKEPWTPAVCLEGCEKPQEKPKDHYIATDLPALAKEYEAFKRAKPGERVVPDVPWEMLAALDLTEADWAKVAEKATWTQVRMNLNTFERHKVFGDLALTKRLAEKLRDKEEIKKAKAFPYQLMVAYLNAVSVPPEVRNALQDAMEAATDNVPAIEGNLVVVADVSGSMSSAITGHREGGTSKVRCVDVAGLVASCILRKNPGAKVFAVDTSLHMPDLNPRDSVITNAQKLAAFCGGGTNLSLALLAIEDRKMPVDFYVCISDMESWVDSHPAFGYPFRDASPTMDLWVTIKRRCPKAKMLNINIQAGTTTQAQERDDILNVGGFSDAIFALAADFAAGRTGAEYWTKLIEEVAL